MLQVRPLFHHEFALHPVRERNIPEVQPLLKHDALARREEPLDFADIVPLLNVDIGQEIVQRFAFCRLLGGPDGFFRGPLLRFEPDTSLGSGNKNGVRAA